MNASQSDVKIKEARNENDDFYSNDDIFELALLGLW